jgi:DNA-binding transcriptional MerR regulator
MPVHQAPCVGYSLEEIQDLLALRVRHGVACEPVDRKTRQKTELVKGKIRDLERIRETLEQLAGGCAARRPTDD